MRKLKNEELGRVTPDKFKQMEKIPVVLVLDNIRSLNNIGSIFRTGDSFRVQSIFLCGITGQPPHREIHKTALGATESVDWKYFADVREALLVLKKMGFTILAIEQTDTGSLLQDFIPENNQQYALIFGNEINGISDHILDLVDKAIEIPQFGTKHSFNVTVSAGIVLWHLFLTKQH